MQHCTPEQLGLAALREPLPDADAAHLAGCEQCRAEVASLQRAVDALAVPQLAAPGASVAPPPGVWAAIAAATGVTAAPRPEVVAASAQASVAPAPPLAAAPRAVEAPAVEAPAVEDPVVEHPAAASGGSVLPFRPRRRPLLLVAAAAVAGAAIGAGAVAVLRDGGTEPIGREPVVDTVAAVALDPLADNDASGRASVIERTDGTRALEVELRAGDLDDRYYEVWLIDEAVQDMVSVGVARSGTVTFELPVGLDLGRFPIVDVSVEPVDGDPAHSGVSVARGVLDT
ncbi:anti-sigma factor [Blastococcus sp. CT_GayMR19]|uniref:anti-sigma factor n=1 Tax=Blastococcus sp. CT_GayMR19 TaxID=2559608 RepID=UPI001074167F|nr:anti-sigma factor [Blastococcus sp. CT_GayMR19]TFV75006.1 anti-sigma factor [Blastococcus sp. CT_GayMR19]